MANINTIPGFPATDGTPATGLVPGSFNNPINAMRIRRFLERAKFETQYFSGTVPASIAKQGGSATALWRRVENLTPTVSALSQLTTDALPTRVSSQATLTDLTASVAKYGAFVTLNEEVDLFNFDGTHNELMDVLAEQAGRSLNMIQRNEMEDNATPRYASGAVNDAAVVAPTVQADLDNVINDLARNSARPFASMTTGADIIATNPIMKSFWGITHPDVAHDISGLADFKSIEKYAGQVDVQPGEFGFYGRGGVGIRFMSTADASIDLALGDIVANAPTLRSAGGVNIDIYNTVIYGRSAAGSLGLGVELPTATQAANSSMAAIELISKPLGSSGVSDALNELGSIGWKAWSAAKILNPDWIRNIHSGATAL